MRRYIDIITENQEVRMRVYHGSVHDFDSFDPDKSADGGAFGKGFYFSNDFGLGRTYSDGKDPIVCTVTLKNPWLVDLDLDYFDPVRKEQKSVFRFKGSRDRLIEMGYDGVLVKERNYRELIAYYPSQIEVLGRLGRQSPIGVSLNESALASWFGDSQVVDQQGQPLKCYHGTEHDFDTFDPEHTGKTSDNGWFGKGLYFTPCPEQASRYATVIRTSPGFGNDAPKGSVMPVYLKAENPFVTDHQSFNQDYVNRLRQEGHDAIFRVNRTGDAVPEEIVVFEPHQVKSAVGNRGTYNPMDNRITEDDE